MSYPKFATVNADGKEHYGIVTDTGFISLSNRMGAQYPTLKDVIIADKLKHAATSVEGQDDDFTTGNFTYQIPVANGEKLICIGVNYPARNEEYKDGQAAPPFPSMFIRFARSFTGHDTPLIRPKASNQLDYEGEVTLVIGKGGRHIAEADALDHIAGVTLCNEGTLRDWVRHAKFNVTQGKNFDSTGSIGPWMVAYQDESQIADIRLTTKVNGELRQDDRTSRMLFPFRYLINYISTFTTLQPGDIIVTGTPTGSGARLDPPVYLKPGDVVEVEAQGIGCLRNSITDEV
ncbi:MAG: fumarylacetoacetate hydrolase family protein [Gammaproteobacteria bacterium]|jgi:2-keto-4-pentenoate hydratase/2-oxohepta-3-ene-1,7-dioic acid hydratase in catechol pathway|nr:fumarylacetoacetate hydrolase family protein [Gammaproteobacteria bacterium]